MNTRTRLLLVAVILSTAASAHAQSPPPDLADASLEELMNIQITSASRKEQRAEDVAGAVYVITHDDIRRSGMTSVPDLLRLAPGVQVAQINANKWAVSIRGFNGLYSNKLLVLIDGRSLYNPLFASVLWDVEDLMLEDVDRIEVIRGPGGAVWGANAVNAVINILTRPAAGTLGLLVRAGVGTFDQGNLAVRYGGAAGSGAYRVYAQLTNHGNSLLAPGAAADDHWRSFTSGFRGDWSAGPDAFIVQGGLSAGQQRPLWVSLGPAAAGHLDTSGTSTTQTGNVFGRWTRTDSGSGKLQVQSFVDLAHRRESVGEYDRRTFDLDADYHTILGPRHDVIVGGGYRYISEAIVSGIGYSFTPNHKRVALLNTFAQDEIALVPTRVTLTVGGKLEYSNGEGASLLPTARIMWKLRPRQRLWGAVSRAVRTPSLVDESVHAVYPPGLLPVPPGTPSGVGFALSVNGNPAIRPERLVSTEVGYRVDVGSRVSIDVAGFQGHYTRLQTTEPSAPALEFIDGRPVIRVAATFENLLEADTRGVEIAGRVALRRWWQIDGTVAAFHLTPHPDIESHDVTAAASDGLAPGYQWRGHSALSLGPKAQADVLLFYVGSLHQTAVPSYTRADARLDWNFNRRFTVTAQGQNLLSPSHAEWASDAILVATRIPRSGSLRLTWRF
jgi:iron complex outermembrane receptor protein